MDFPEDSRLPLPRPMVPALICWTLLAAANLLRWENFHPDYALNYFWPPIGRLTLAGVLHAQADNLRELLAFGLTLAGCLGAGSSALRWTGTRRATGVFGLAVRLMGGSALLGFAAAGLGLAGLADRSIHGAFLVAALCGVRRRMAGDVKLRERLGACPGPLKLLGGVVATGALLGALAPEVAMDGLEVYLEMPRRALLAHRLVPDPYLALTWSYLLPTGTALVLQALGSEIAVRLWSWSAMVLVALALHEWQSQRTTPRHAWWAAASWLCLSTVGSLGQTAMQEMPLALLVLLGALAQFVRRRSDLAGACWGLAVGYKLVAGGYAAAALAAGLLVGGTSPGVWLLGAGAATAPWLLRNWLQAGVPTAPVFLAGAAGAWARGIPGQWNWAEHRSMLAMLRFPWEARTISVVSPLVIAAVPAALLTGSSRWQRLLILLCLGWWLWLSGNNARYLIPLAPLMLPAFWDAVLGAPSARRPAPALRAGGLGLLAAEVILTFGWLYYTSNPLAATYGRLTRRTYLAGVLLPRQAKVLCADRVAGWNRLAAGQAYLLTGDLEGHYLGGRPLADEVNGVPRALGWATESPDERRLRVKFTQARVAGVVLIESGQGRAAEYVRADDARWPRRETSLLRSLLLHYATPAFRVSTESGACAGFGLSARPLRTPVVKSSAALIRWWNGEASYH